MIRSAVLLLALTSAAAVAGSHDILTADGFGPLRVGMTLKQAESVIGHRIELNDPASEDAKVCSGAYIPGWPHIGALFENLRITVIYIDKPYRSVDGVYIGMPETSLRKLFGSRAIFSFRPYFGDDPHAHNVVVKLGGKREFLFQTKDDVVENISVGDYPSVEYWEGCA